MISVIIPVFNREKDIYDCVTSILLSQCSYRYEIIIVDNNSTDNTFQISKRLQENNENKVKIVKCFKKGPGAARNIGIKNASFGILAFIDSDCIMPPSYLQKAIDIICENQEYHAVGGPYHPVVKNKSAVSFAEMKFWEKIVMSKYPNHKTQLKKDNSHFVSGYLQGGNMIMNTMAMKHTVSFKEKFINSQDVVISWDIVKNGGKILWIPELFVEHNLNAKEKIIDILKPWYKRGANHKLLAKRYNGKIERLNFTEIIRNIFPIDFKNSYGECLFILTLFSYYFGRFRGK